jgi:hypothetical protein
LGGGSMLLLIRCPANGEGAKLRGQGPRAEAVAARRMPACESRDAGGVTPSRWRCSRRLGRRYEAGPRQLLRRVRRRDHASYSYPPNIVPRMPRLRLTKSTDRTTP